MSKSVLEELVTVLGFDIEDGDLKSFNQKTKEAVKTLRNIALVGTGAATGIGIFINSIATATDATFKFSKTVGASFGEVQKLAHATQIWGGSAEDAMSSIEGLAKITSLATRGKGGGEIFGILGISPSDASSGGPKNTIDLLKEVADKIKGMDAARQLDLIGQLGISKNMILLLRQGSDGIKQLGDEVERYGFVLSPEQGRVAEDFVDAMVRGKLAVRGLSTEIGLRLAPPLQELIDKFLEWRSANREIIDSNLDEFVEKLVKSVKPLAMFMAIITGALVLMGILAFGAEAAFIALAAAFSLALSDFHDFVNGVENTRSGDAFEKLKKFGEAQRGRIRKAKEFVGGVQESAMDKGLRIRADVLESLRILEENKKGKSGVPGQQTSFAPTIHIRANDTGAILRELDSKLNDMWAGSTMLA